MESDKIALALAILADALGLDPDVGMLAVRGPDEEGTVEVRIMMHAEPPDAFKADLGDAGDVLADEVQRYLGTL